MGMLQKGLLASSPTGIYSTDDDEIRRWIAKSLGIADAFETSREMGGVCGSYLEKPVLGMQYAYHAMGGPLLCGHDWRSDLYCWSEILRRGRWVLPGHISSGGFSAWMYPIISAQYFATTALQA